VNHSVVFVSYACTFILCQQRTTYLLNIAAEFAAFSQQSDTGEILLTWSTSVS